MPPTIWGSEGPDRDDVGSEHAQPARGGDGRGARPDLKFAEGVRQVGADGARTDEERGGDLPVGAAVGNQPQDSVSRGVKAESVARPAVPARPLPQ